MVRRVSQPPFLAQPGGRQQVGIVATVCENAEPRYQNPAQEKELPARNQIGQWNEWGERPKECIPGRLIDTLNNESPGILWDMTTSSVQFDIIIQEDYNQCHTKSSYQTWRSDQRPAPAHLCLLYKCPTQSFETAANPSRFAPFWQGAQSLAPATQNDIWTSKNAPQPFFSLLTSKCASRNLKFQKWSATVSFLHLFLPNCPSRHDGVHFFHIITSKSAPALVCFVCVYFEMCFAPQRRAIVHLSSGQIALHPPL